MGKSTFWIHVTKGSPGVGATRRPEKVSSLQSWAWDPHTGAMVGAAQAPARFWGVNILLPKALCPFMPGHWSRKLVNMGSQA